MKQTISIIVPVYNEAENIRPFFDEVKRVVRDIPFVVDILFVDDGSTDKTADVVVSLEKGAPTVQLIRLSRNFGKEAAVAAGLATAKGDAAIIIDADLQHPVQKIPAFIAAWQQGADVVVGVRIESGDNRWIKRFGSALFYKLINAISNTKIIPNETDFRLLDREVIDQYNLLTERNRNNRGLIDWLGYDRETVLFDANQRLHGTPKYSYRRLTRLAINTFVSYSFFPIRFAGYLGIFIMAVAGLTGLFVAVEDTFMHDPLGLNITGTGLLALSILFFVGVILACLGLFGLYIASIHDETTNRPLYVIRKNNKIIRRG